MIPAVLIAPGAFGAGPARRLAVMVGSLAVAVPAPPVVPSLPAAWLAIALPTGFIGPLLGQLALVRGEHETYSAADGSLSIGGRQLIGPAGKVFGFAAAETAQRWADNARAAGLREVETIAGLSAEWKASKRGKLAVIAGRVVAAAARQGDAGIKAALLAEADFCLAKWGAV